MGYRKYAKDYEIEYVQQPGKKREKPVRIYVGPYFRFKASPERITRLRWLYLIGMLLIAAMLIVPMCLDCTFTRIWYVQGPAAAAWIPWLLAAGATWRLWTAKELVDREHHDMMVDRMGGASLFLMGLCCVTVAACVIALLQNEAELPDKIVCGCYVIAAVCGVALFSRRKELEMLQVENPEKPQTKKKG